jgi:GTPase SAR1 family protein
LASINQRFACSKPDCTAAATGTCLLGKPSPQECEFYVLAAPPQSEELPGQGTTTAPTGRTFHPGSELGTVDALEVSSGSYAHVVGLIGPYNAGKTCFLLSLYLMASRQLMPEGYLFRRSLTLQGFEDRAHKLREWRSGPLPEKLADHTILADDRRPGFLHLGVVRHDERIDFLFSDLPGEWTTSLINRADTAARWEFLKRADGIIVVFDGTELVGKDRYVQVTGAQHLFQRLQETLRIPTDIPLVILVSKADEIEMRRPQVLDEIQQSAIRLGFAPTVILCASFSRKPEVVANGHGVISAVEHLIARSSEESYIDWAKFAADPSGDPPRPFRQFKFIR